MGETIRVLHVLGRLDRGGAETMIMNLYRHMDRQLVQFDFVLHTAEECSYSEEVRALGGRIFSVPAYSLKTAAGYRRAWKIFFAQHPEYRILHSHVRSTASLYLPIAKESGLTTIIHSHNTSSGSGIRALVKTALQLPLRRQADYLFACGRQAGEWLYGKRACSSPRFFVLPNAVEIAQFRFDGGVRREVRQTLDCQEETLVVGHVGRLEEQKNHRFLLRVYAQICSLQPDSMLLLIGEGPLEKEIKRYAQQLGIAGKVRFLGNREDVNRLLQGMDVFVFPSRYEGLPVTLVEAQAAGLAVVMSDAVTEEVILTDLVQTLPLQDRRGQTEENQAKLWAQQSIKARTAERRDRTPEIQKAGYDIEATAKWVAEFYRSLS